MHLRRIGFCIGILFFLIFFVPVFVHASEDFATDYVVEYSPFEENDTIVTQVKLSITIVNLRSDLYIKKIGFGFPLDFPIEHTTARDQFGPVPVSVTSDINKQEITAEFSNPSIGKNVSNTLTFEFTQAKLFQTHGNVWEVLLPTIEESKRRSYTVLLHLPQNSSRRISIAKPVPDNIQGNTIRWMNPSTRTIFALFGERQYYQLSLQYYLENPKLTPVYTDIALPPDTTYQKTYVESLLPAPKMVYLDDDGNYLARYILIPKQSIQVQYKGTVELSSSPITNRIETFKNLVEKQRPYLLGDDTNWRLTNPEQFQPIKGVQNVYQKVTSTLSYDTKRSLDDVKRFGAQGALDNPTKAVCVEFSDLFIALCREKGILAREVQGYAYSQLQQLRPVSLASDVLHSWPEYYDEVNKLWVPIDPTWERTSGIDYFSSFDLNHITFAIHGKKSDYPYPAGMYKKENSKDIFIKPVENPPLEKNEVVAEISQLPSTFYGSSKKVITVTLRNTGNVFAWNVPVSLKTNIMSVENNSRTIPILAPFEEKKISFSVLVPPVLKVTRSNISFLLDNKPITNSSIAIYPSYYQTAFWIIGIIAVLSITMGVIIIVKKMIV